MATICNVKLELLRSGPSHNQLLSPLTPYIALCGADGPVTLNLPFEHRQLLNRLARLRYEVGGTPVSAEQRESEVQDIGETLGRVLGSVPTLISELAHAGGGGGLIHLRLSVSALELGMVPFEFAIGADGFPASGSPLFIQSQAPITITREVRRGQKLDVSWNRPPRILFAFACPNGLPAVPAQDHLCALRRAIDPWVKWRPGDNEASQRQRMDAVKSMLTVLPNASLKSISEACDQDEYTYVHILAHGAPYEQAGDKHYGVALCSENGLGNIDIIDGERLAIALTANDAKGCIRHRPTLVSLATCDSGTVNTVITPGGNIAQGLNVGGIPWVIASQFPLWMRSSTIAAEVLYQGILQGDDPRWVLYNLRQSLFTRSNSTHDWASIVAYASIPDNFDQQINAFSDFQRRKKLEVMFDIADEHLKAHKNNDSQDKLQLPESYQNLHDLYQAIRFEHENWLKELGSVATPEVRAAIYALYGAAEKRIAELCESKAATGENVEGMAQQAKINARNYYKKSMELDPSKHWAITQYLFMHAVMEPENTPPALGDLWTTARHIASMYQNKNGEIGVGALATLAELELLKTIHKPSDQNLDDHEIIRLCQRMIDAVDADAFLVKSTRRQFQRYKEIFSNDKLLQKMVTKALEVLGSGD